MLNIDFEAVQMMDKELQFLHSAENLKQVLRHSFLSKGRQESVAEHSWRLALMAYRYADRLDQPVDVNKCIKMALIHDLAEAKVGDIPVFAQNSEVQKIKYQNEERAMQEYCQLLGDHHADEMFALWLEHEKQQTYESKFVKALDKLEAFMQHFEADLSTWEDREKRMVFQEKWLIRFCKFDSFLNSLCDAILKKCTQKLTDAGEDVAIIIEAARVEELEWSSAEVLS